MSLTQICVTLLAVLLCGAGLAAASFEGDVDAQMTCAQMGSLISTYFPANDTQVMLCIAYYASGYNPTAQGANGAIGLFQILPRHCGEPGCPPNNDDCQYVRNLRRKLIDRFVLQRLISVFCAADALVHRHALQTLRLLAFNIGAAAVLSF